MTYEMKLQEMQDFGYNKGKTDGKIEGKIEGRAELITNMLKNQMKPEQIAKIYTEAAKTSQLISLSSRIYSFLTRFLVAYNIFLCYN